MKIVLAPRAAAILYNVLVSRADLRPWLLPANICPIVPITFLKAGVPFEFVDILAHTLHMDLVETERRLKHANFGGVLYAHTYGDSSTPVEFFSTLKSLYPEVLLIDDRCLCVPDIEPDPTTTADVILYSTGYAKIVELNFGGFAFVNDNVHYTPVILPFNSTHLADTERSYKQAIQFRHYFVYEDNDWLETDSDIPTWDAYRQRIKASVEKSTQQRVRLNSIYVSQLPAEIQLPQAYQTWRFNIRVKNKRSLLNEIFAAGLFASSHFASLSGIMAQESSINAELLAEEVINLFNDYHFTASQAEQTCKVILKNMIM